MHYSTIDTTKKLKLFDLKELFSYKGLFYTLAHREYVFYHYSILKI